jgi:hypothetical protein
MGEARRRRLKGDPTPHLTFYHSLHSCGHAVYWQDWRVGMATGRYPCPWCGGETAIPSNMPPLTERVLTTAAGLIVRIKNPDGSFPLPAELHERRGVIRHMTGEVCCKPPKPWPDGW